MAEFSVNINGLERASVAIEQQALILQKAKEEVNVVRHELAIEGNANERIKAGLKQDMMHIEKDILCARKIRNTLEEIEKSYNMTEKGLRDRINKAKIIWAMGVQDFNIINVLYGAPPVISKPFPLNFKFSQDAFATTVAPPFEWKKIISFLEELYADDPFQKWKNMPHINIDLVELCRIPYLA